MGGEFAQWNEWDFDRSLQWDLLEWDSHRGVQKCVADLNRLMRSEKALHQLDFDGRGFYWIDCHNCDESTLSYVRRAKDPNDFLVVCCNFTPVPRMQHRIGVPKACWYEEVFNSDSTYYGGSNLGNAPGVRARDEGRHGLPASIDVVLPPLAAVVFKPRP
jgi:1,4-alpha-glucan branching enzyme